LYLCGLSGEPISTIDDQVMLTSAMSFVKTGKFIVPERFATKTIGTGTFGRTAVSGDVYAKYPPGYPLVLAAFLPASRVVGMALGSTAADVILCLPSILALIATIILLWRMCIRLGFSAAAAHVTAAGFALGSFAWPYAGINFSEPLQTLCITAAVYSLIAAFQDERHWKFYLLAGGGALGYGVLTKASLGLLVPILASGALWGWIWTSRLPIAGALMRSALFSLPSLAAAGYLLLVNALMFGNPQDFGYKGESFGTSAFSGLRELTFGWEKGLLWFVPLVVLAPLGAWKLRKHQMTWVVPSLGACCVVYFLLVALWGGFRGGNCWGPRLLMPELPILLLLAGAALDSTKMRVAGACLVAAGLAVNLLGVLIQYQSYYITLKSAIQKPDRRRVEYAQIPGHFWLLRVQLAKKSWNEPEEQVALWRRPPWIARNAEAIPAPYTRFESPILNPWWLRAFLKSPWQTRADRWYLRTLMEVAIIKYQTSDLKGAMDLMNEGLAMDPEYAPLVAAKGMIYYTARNLSRALAQFERSVAINPEYELGWYGRGLVMESLGNASLAVQSYQRLLKTSMRDMNREEIEQRLANLAK
jgi:4-amino-4-deoxy-L-arabinose transferase-like glycosyltransferase